MTTSQPAPRAHKLGVFVRAMARVSGRGLPPPVCPVAVETGIEVPAGDGVMLRTDHYLPLMPGPRPALLVRSPYGRGFPWNYLFGALFAGQGFHVVIQSCRGTGGSGGELEPGRHERADGHAAVAWLREQDWFSGALGTIGPSYLGYVQWALAADPPPELRAIAVQNGFTDLHGLLYRGGVFALEDALTGSAAMLSFEHGLTSVVRAMTRLLRKHRQVERTLPLIDAYPVAFGRRVGFFEQWLSHPGGGEEYWRGLDAGTAGPGVAVSLVSGWQDICLDQTLAAYRRLRDAGRDVRLVIGPWTHTSAFEKGWPVVFTDVLGWLRAHLGAEPGGEPRPPVRVHVGGCDQWRDLPSWPPPQARSQPWYLSAGGQLSPVLPTTVPPTTVPPERPPVSSLHYDPAAPTPSVGGPLLGSRTSGIRRNDALEARADVLTFTSAPLTGAAEVIGPVSARLRVRGSSPHFDVFARLCDVDPRGHSRNVCDGLVRHRPGDGDGDGWSTVTVAMGAAAYRFGAGHRLRLQISGGAHPRFTRNTGTGEPPATATRLVPVDIEISHETGSPAALSLPLVTSGVLTRR